MQSNAARAAIAVGAVAVIVVLFVVFSGGDDDGGGDAEPAADQATTTTTSAEPSAAERAERRRERAAERRRKIGPTIVVRGGEPVDGVRELDFEQGEQIKFAVKSNVDEEIHVHGYDVTEPIVAGKLTKVSFPAEIDGLFEVELHGSGAQIAELRVNP